MSVRAGDLPRVAIIGAGASGLCLAIRLQQTGLATFTVFEKSDGVGGTWRDNTYPGAGCDVPSHLYSYSFAPKHDWTRKFAEQGEILGYFEGCAARFGLLPHLRFSNEISTAEFDETDQVWRLSTTDGDEFVADVLVAATGQLNQPHIPDIDGTADFGGTLFHSARWDHAHDLTGEAVAVVGTGASAIQFVPPLAREARSVTIFQRSPNYVGPKPDRAFRPWEKRLFAAVPTLDRLYRWSIYGRFEMRFVLFRHPSRIGTRARAMFAKGLAPLVSERLPSDAVIPDYPLGCKRILISNEWYETLSAPHVRVVTDPIEQILPEGVRTADGTIHPVDTIILGTGFQATRFLGPIEVHGVGGRKLADVWREGAFAHLGMAVPGFPNMFLLYGPNTNLGHNSILFMVERQVAYIARCIARLERGAAPLDVRTDVMADYEAEISRRMAGTVWAAGCRSWYKTKAGRVTNNWPGFTLAYWRKTLRPRPSDFTTDVRRNTPDVSQTVEKLAAIDGF